ncbi:MAG: EAL domain-containing protein, partial [Woeseiaceae bacterium]|nr:EAL domain-containing protein [Woeseiaceae bacterium]
LRIEQQLYTALERRELKLAYQPIVDVSSNRVVGAEALLRWPQPDGSFIGPDEFVPIAEDAGFMISIGEFVIEEACRQLRAWGEAGMDSLTIAVNIARCQLMDPGLVDFVSQCLEKYAVEPAWLDFELSERGALSGDESVLSQLFQLKSLGITISVDDFGTGEASIAYLKDMPVDHLKIDRSYIARLAYDGKESRMISAMIALAHRLRLKVVAEGIESAAQLNILQSLDCDLYQGFHFSRAVDPELFPAVAFPQPD